MFHAVALLGGINTTLNPLYTAAEAAHQLKDSGARFLVTERQFIDKARIAAQEAGIKELFMFGLSGDATPFVALMDEGAEVPHVEINPKEDLVALPYSSGTELRSRLRRLVMRPWFY